MYKDYTNNSNFINEIMKNDNKYIIKIINFEVLYRYGLAYYVLEKCNYDVMHYININSTKISEDFIKNIMKEILR